MTYTYDADGTPGHRHRPGRRRAHATPTTASDRIASITDARGIAYLSVTYDANGRVATQTLPNGAEYSFAYVLDGAGKVTETRVTHPGGSVRRVAFDAAGRATSDTEAFGTSSERTTTFVRATSGRVDAVVDPYGRRTETAYDAQNRVVRVTELAGTPQSRVTQRFTYGSTDLPLTSTDAAGKVTTLTYDARRNLTSVKDPLNRTARFTYTTRGRLTTSRDPAGRTTTFAYRGLDLASVTDPLGRVSRQFTDAAGRPIATPTRPASRPR